MPSCGQAVNSLRTSLWLQRIKSVFASTQAWIESQQAPWPSGQTQFHPQTSPLLIPQLIHSQNRDLTPTEHKFYPVSTAPTISTTKGIKKERLL